jgi:hypothetical protein
MQNSTTLISLLTGIIIIFLIIGCDADNKKGTKVDEEALLEDQQSADTKLEENIKKAKKVFYSLPSPLETAILFRHAGATFDKDILNPLESVKNYTTNKSMALNLGIYTADLSYASLFDQTQISIKYMAASKELADRLGVMDAIDKDMIVKLEENVNNKAVIMDIISQAFLNSNTSLKENDRAAMASIMLVGGWVEGLFIATRLTRGKATDSELVNRIIDQRLPLESIVGLLEAYNDVPDVTDILKDIKDLKSVFDKIQISSSKIVPVVDKKTNITTLKSTTETTLSEEVYQELCNKVEQIRSSYIK